jgi:hypothetical protein
VDYAVFNQPVEKQRYFELLKELNLSNFESLKKAKEKFQTFLSDKDIPHIIGHNLGGSTGNYLWDCEDVFNSFDCRSCKGLYYCDSMQEAENCLDGVGYGRNSGNLAQFALVGDGAQNVRNSVECWNNVSNLDYCSHCEDSSDLFGCVGLRGKQFCILNKQYEKEVYHKARDEIVQHLIRNNTWGNFFPPGFCGLPYNLSAAQVHIPLNRAPAKLMGFRWDDEEEKLGLADLVIEGKDDSLPDFESINTAPNTLAELEARDTDGERYLCEISARQFRIFEKEVAFYKEINVAPPAKCFEQRHLERVRRLASKDMHLRPLKKKMSFKMVVTSFSEGWHRPITERVQP